MGGGWLGLGIPNTAVHVVVVNITGNNKLITSRQFFYAACIGLVLPVLVLALPMVGLPPVAFGKMSFTTMTTMQATSKIAKITNPAIAPDLNFLKLADVIVSSSSLTDGACTGPIVGALGTTMGPI